MNFKFLMLGAAIGFVLAAAPSCGSSNSGVTDAGTGGGTGTGGGIGRVDSGSGGGTGMVDSGTVDSGSVNNTPIACNVMSQNCPAGAGSCMYVGNQGAGQCFKGDCDVVAQNCAPAAQCDYGQLSDGGVGRVCLAAGTVAEGGDCSATAFCGKGNICLTDGKCHKFCYTSNDCGNGGLCNITVGIPGTTEQPAVCLRLEACNPLTQNCSKTADSCYPATPTASACFPTGMAAIGAACGQNFCVKGGACLLPSSSSTSGVCRQMCNLDAGRPSCDGGAVCGTVQGVTAFGICP